jgi:hypothetical protein
MSEEMVFAPLPSAPLLHPNTHSTLLLQMPFRNPTPLLLTYSAII